MHELSIAMNIVDLASAEAERHGGGVVSAVHLKIGPLSGVVTEALTTAFELARQHTPLSTARLVVEEPPVVIDCKKCAGHRPAKSIQSMVCTTCSTPSGRVVGGRELELTALEIEE